MAIGTLTPEELVATFRTHALAFSRSTKCDNQTV